MAQKIKKVKREILERWTDKKIMNKEMSKKLTQIGEIRRAERMKECSEHLEMTKCPKCGKKHIAKAELCRDRICPICQWRLSRKRAFEMLKVLEQMEKTQEYKYQFLTLTQNNVPVYRLREELKKINNAWYKILKSNFTGKPKGYARIIEITYNAKKREVHPHQHIIIAWENGDKTIKRTEWAKKWQKALNISYEPICRLKYIKSKQKDDKYISSVLETYKYSVKSTDLLQMPNEIFKLFLLEIKGTRACSYTGVFKEWRKKLKMKNETEIENINDEQIKCTECGNELVRYVLEWSYADERYKEVLKDE